jgi:hypothetical protein
VYAGGRLWQGFTLICRSVLSGWGALSQLRFLLRYSAIGRGLALLLKRKERASPTR